MGLVLFPGFTPNRPTSASPVAPPPAVHAQIPWPRHYRMCPRLPRSPFGPTLENSLAQYVLTRQYERAPHGRMPRATDPASPSPRGRAMLPYHVALVSDTPQLSLHDLLPVSAA